MSACRNLKNVVSRPPRNEIRAMSKYPWEYHSISLCQHEYPMHFSLYLAATVLNLFSSRNKLAGVSIHYPHYSSQAWPY